MTRYNTKPCRTCHSVTSVLPTVKTGESVHAVQGKCDVFATVEGRTALFSRMDPHRAIVECRGCGKHLWAKPVLGKFVAEKLCDGRCTSATGHNCECQCGGKNHGAACAA